MLLFGCVCHSQLDRAHGIVTTTESDTSVTYPLLALTLLLMTREEFVFFKLPSQVLTKSMA